MADFVERDKVHDVVEQIIDDNYGYYRARELIDSIPAADVWEVVHCADCKHNNACLTQAFVEDASVVPFDHNTFFCADGER